jgi:hypothetical protein
MIVHITVMYNKGYILVISPAIAIVRGLKKSPIIENKIVAISKDAYVLSSLSYEPKIFFLRWKTTIFAIPNTKPIIPAQFHFLFAV